MGIDYSYIHDSIRQKVINQQNARHFDDRQLAVAEYANAIIAPRTAGCKGGLFADGKTVKYSNCYDEIDAIAADCKIKKVDEEVLFLGMLYSPWGHCITDHLSRAWPLLDKNGALRKLRIVYVMVGETEKMPDNYFRLFEAIGVSPERITRLNKPTRFRMVYFPDRSFWHNEKGDDDHIRHYTKEYVATVDAIRAATRPNPSTATRRVYLSRNGWKKGLVDFGEQTLEQVFASKYNCEVVHPETLTFNQMVRLMYESKVLATTDGSIAHNAIFGPDGLKMIIVRKSDFVNYHQPVINDIRKLDITYLDAYHEGWLFNNREEPWVGPFYLYASKEVARFLGGGKQFSIMELVRYLKCFCSDKVHRAIDRIFKRRV